MKHAFTLLFGAPLLVLSIARLDGQEPSVSNASPSGVDQQFVDDAVSDGAAEIGLARLAVEKASSERTRSLAQRLLADHEVVNQELLTIAAQRHLAVPSSIGAKQQNTRERLERLSRDRFDQAYKAEVRIAHEAAVAAFTREADFGHDATLRAWARKILPTLQAYLDMVQGESRSSTR